MALEQASSSPVEMTFICSTPDFTIRCLPEGVDFSVNRRKLSEGSNVFADMFACCDLNSNPGPEADSNILEVLESAPEFAILLRLLHDPPQDYPLQSYKEGGWEKYAILNPKSAIPFPVLPLLYQLADKYAASPRIIHALNTNLQAYASTFPLKVYGLASQMSLEWIADEASAFLVQPPLHTYTVEEIKIIPTAEAYHKLLKLQHHRATKLKEILLREELFPHGYGLCPSHKDSALARWDQKRQALLSRIDAGTDVAAEMSTLKATYDSCEACQKAFVAATEMLAYKCRRVARRISKVS